MAIRHIDQLSAFELMEMHTIQLGLANSTLAIFTSALFAYLILCHAALDKLSKWQLIVVSCIYSFFMLTQILSLFAYYGTASILADHMSTLYSDVPPANVFYFSTPSIAFLSWVVSIFYMLSLRRRNVT